jgi:hypothetical protein
VTVLLGLLLSRFPGTTKWIRQCRSFGAPRHSHLGGSLVPCNDIKTVIPENVLFAKEENTNIILTNSPFWPLTQKIKRVAVSVTHTERSHGPNKLCRSQWPRGCCDSGSGGIRQWHAPMCKQNAMKVYMKRRGNVHLIILDDVALDGENATSQFQKDWVMA